MSSIFGTVWQKASTRHWMLTTVFILVFVTILTICYAAITVQSGVRAYVAGESQWSKSEKDAYIYLARYADTGDASYYDRFRREMTVPLGDHDARLAMLAPDMDWDAASAGFIRGRNSPADVPMMILLFRYAGRLPYMSDAIAIWTEADPTMLEFAALGDQVHALRVRQPLDLAALHVLQQRAFDINTELRPLEDRFSGALALGAHFLSRLLLGIVALGALLTLSLGLLLVRRILNSLHDSETRFRGTFEQAAVGLSHVSLQGVLLQVNDRYCTITGQARERLVGQSFQQILGAQDAEDAWLHCGRLLLGEKPDYVTNRLLANSGSARWARTSYTLVRDEAGTPAYFLNVLEDISGEHRLTEQLSYQASHDALTGLVNRFEFENRVGVALGKVTTGGPVGALCYMDLDQFKIINDTLGHMAGDELLHQLSLELKNRLRVGDTLARLGGDEFGVLLEGCPIGAASSIAETIRRTIDEKRFLWKGREYRVGVSIGVVAIDADTSSVQQLLSDADEACYIAKDKGRNMVHIHEQDSAQLQHRHDEMQWVTRLREALAGEGLFLMYQSILPLQTEQATGQHFEVLLRMRQDGGEIVPPGSFLSAAERYNLGSRVDEWVVREILGWLADRKSELPHIGLCSINLSAQSLGDARFLEFLQTEIYQSGFPAHKLCFELTETAAVADLATAGRFINTIREAGCRFSLDDFGSGMSSFAYLHALPVDFLKIDGAFIRGIASDRVSRAVVSSINDISHTLGKYTIAEFIETELILQTAREIGLDYAQGYAIAKPRDLADLLQVAPVPPAAAVGPIYIPDNALPR